MGIVTLTNVTVHAQERDVAPYVGASANFAGVGGAGWGTEAGLRFHFLYAGIEYGTYAYPIQSTSPEYSSSNTFSGTYPESSEQFLGIHAGYFFDSSIYVGVVALKSYQTWDNVPGYATFTKSWLNIGPDLRYSTPGNRHIYVAGAYTIRRGIKVGIGYMF